MKLAGLKCGRCSGEDIAAIWPGDGGEQIDLFRLTPARPLKVWCWKCWLECFGTQPELPHRGSKAKAKAFTKKC